MRAVLPVVVAMATGWVCAPALAQEQEEPEQELAPLPAEEKPPVPAQVQAQPPEVKPPAQAQPPTQVQPKEDGSCCCCGPAQPPCVLPPLTDEELAPRPGVVPRLSRPRLIEDDATAAARAAIRHDAEVGLAFGAGLMATGLVLAAVHIGATNTAARWYDLVPVTGPAIVAFTEPNEGWTSALLFSGWLEAAGIMTMAIAGSQLASVREHPPAVEVGGSVGSGHAGISVSGHF